MLNGWLTKGGKPKKKKKSTKRNVKLIFERRSSGSGFFKVFFSAFVSHLIEFGFLHSVLRLLQTMMNHGVKL